MHFYTAKRDRSYPQTYEGPHVKLLCSGAWVNYRKTEPVAVTVPHNVTCMKCLDLLLPKAIENVRIMERNYDQAMKAVVHPMTPMDSTDSPGYSKSTHGSES